MIKSNILKLLPAFEERFLSTYVSKWGRQWAMVDSKKQIVRKADGKPIVMFDDARRKGKLFKRHHLEEHFGAKPSYGEMWYEPFKKKVPCVFGSYGMALRLTDGLVKGLCWDADDERTMDLLHTKLAPWLDDKEIDYVLEYSGYEFNRAHLWTATEGVDIRYTNLLFEQIQRDCGVPNIKEWFDEQYPYGKRQDSLIRLPYGLHTKHMDVFLGEYKGKPFESVEEGLEAISIKMGLLTQEKLESLLTEAPREKKVYVEPPKLILSDTFEMAPPMTLPEVPRRLSSKCLAIHKLIDEVINENKLINKRGGLSHNAGLCLSGIFQKQDDLYGGEEGRLAFQSLIESNRDRSAGDHNWDYYWGKKSGQVWRCETMDQTFGNCEGCIYKDRIRNPIQLLKAESLVKHKVGQVRVASLDEIRAEVFPQMEEMVYGALNNGKVLDLVVESVQESGKCFRKGTQVLRFDGTLANVEDIKVGDQVMGPDSKPRNVLSLGRGNETMYEISPARGEGFVCNESHILTLMSNRGKDQGQVYNMTVPEFLKQHERVKRKLKYYRSPQINFKPIPSIEFELDPYTLGAWLGDGTSNRFMITTVDTEMAISMRDAFAERGYKLNCNANTVSRAINLYPRIKKEEKGDRGNYFHRALNKLNLIHNKHIPHKYKTASEKDRLELLAGLIDTDGHISPNKKGAIDFISKSKQLAEDFAFVARSLGYYATVKPSHKYCFHKGTKREGDYWRVFMTGDLWRIPYRLLRKKPPMRGNIGSVLMSGFTIKELPPEDYYGFSVDGDHLFLLGDFTVVHNSHAADALAAKLASEGKRVAIACNSINVALEHKERVEKAGARAFIMASFESIFDRDELSNGLVCPNEQAIKDCRGLGVPSSYYKKKYCKSCPFNDECAFPNQYTQVQEDKYKVVIIQHAHFACEETIRQLFKKHFDVLIIDENFNDFLINQLIPSQKEIDLLQEFEDRYDWVYPLVKWMVRGGKPPQHIEPLKNDLAPIRTRFNEEKEPYRLPDFLRCYRAGDWFDTEIGIMKFIPIPECQVRIVLDATATMKELKILLNNPNLKSIGGGVVAAPKAYHKDNEVIQILNGSASKTAMVGKEKLYEWLEYIGDTMMAPGNEDKTCLITTFKEYIDPITREKSYPEQDAIDWLDRNYPSIIPRIAINRMSAGTNKWAHFNYQFILANVYINPKTMRHEVYKLKFIENYWRQYNGDPKIRNPYPGTIPDNVGESEHMVYVPYQYIDEEGNIWQCPQYKYKRPVGDFYESCVWERICQNLQQSERIRQSKIGKLTKTFIGDRVPLKSRVVTRIAEEDEFLAQYRE